jgi:ubiquinone biosynthesis protein COQ9
VWATADAIWWFAGDTATDFNHYTKRGLLAGVLGSTTLYWLSDNSEGQRGTEAFLMRRLQDVLKIGKTLGRAGRFAPSSAMLDAVKSAMSRFQRGFDRGARS